MDITWFWSHTKLVFLGEFVEGQGRSSLKGEGFPALLKIYILTKGVIPQVCGQKSQSFLERQVVGLAPFPH